MKTWLTISFQLIFSLIKQLFFMRTLLTTSFHVIILDRHDEQFFSGDLSQLSLSLLNDVINDDLFLSCKCIFRNRLCHFNCIGKHDFSLSLLTLGFVLSLLDSQSTKFVIVVCEAARLIALLSQNFFKSLYLLFLAKSTPSDARTAISNCHLERCIKGTVGIERLRIVFAILLFRWVLMTVCQSNQCQFISD